MDKMVFVYGSLRKGRGNHPLIEGCPFVGMAHTEPRYTLLNLGAFPGVVAQGSTPIIGEVYEVSPAVMQDLDRLEGHPSFYCREEVPVYVDEACFMAWIYLLGADWLGSCEVVESGDWLARGPKVEVSNVV